MRRAIKTLKFMWSKAFPYCALMSAMAMVAGDVHGASDVYVNQEYGYAVRVPEKLNIKYPKAPNPNHGIKIFISVDGLRYVWADGSFNVGSSSDLRQVATAQVNEGAHVRMAPAELGNMRAIRVRGRNCDAAIKSATECETVVALRTQDRSSDIVYTVGLVSDRAHFSADRKVLQFVAENFAVRPLPK